MTDDLAPRGALSMDGRTFTGHLPLDTPMLVGGMVLVSTPSQTRLGQVVEKVVEGHRVAVRGLLLAALDPGPVLRPLVPAPFAGASLDPASADVLVAHQAMVGADLPVATLSVDGAEVPARLRSRGFNRHTFLCGQSGSGKTYALGVLLERLLLGTGLRMVVVDPNADYVHLGRQRDGIDPAVVERLRDARVRVLRAVAPGEQVHEPDPLGAEPLVTLFPELSPAAKSALIGLDPLRDRNEYTLMLDLVERMRSGEVDDLESELLTSPDPAAMALAQRMHNLGVDRWTLWAQGRTPLREVVDAGARATVLDLSGFSTSTERSAATVALLDHLWEQRESRVPTLIVIDEAHNVCSAEPEDKVQALATERLIQIAGEGRKYGLWLLLSTQRPSKIHPNVLSQCDNLALMRMNSPADLAELATVFGFAPPSMLAESPYFRQGEVLLAGHFAAAPMFARMSERYTPEGGSDVPVPAAVV